MNCQSAQRLLSARRDDTLASDERVALEGHLTGCADCRRREAMMSAALESWRAAAAGAKAPDAERAWQDVHRAIRVTRPAEPRGALGRWALPFGAVAAAAAIALMVFTPQWKNPSTPIPNIARVDAARADFVEVPTESSSVVYVDGESGWLVVWAVDNSSPTRL